MMQLKFLVIRCLLGIYYVRDIKTNNNREWCWLFSLKHGWNAAYYKFIIFAIVNISGLQCALVHIP